MTKAIKKIAGKKPVGPQISVAEFNALPKATQRVIIAEDVIKQVETKRYKPIKSIYVQLAIPRGILAHQDAKTYMHKIKSCTVCALGACIMSSTRFKNNLTMGEIHNPLNDSTKLKIAKLLKTVFTANQLALIECAFEGCVNEYGFWSTNSCVKDGGIGGSVPVNMIFKIKKFAEGHPNKKERLIAIMENLITNKGTFKP